MARSDRDAGGPAIAADLDALRRLEPPAEDAEQRARIMRNVLDHPALYATPAMRRHGRAAALIAALAAAALLSVWTATERRPPQPASDAAPAPAFVRLRAGSIEVDGGMLRAGAELGPSTAIRILAEAEPAELVLRDASVLRAAHSTQLIYSADTADPVNGVERFRLERGRVSLQVNGRARSSPLVIETAELSAWVVGTRFDVARDQHGAVFSTTVAVDEGVVRVIAASTGQVRLLAAGERITLPVPSAPELGAPPEPARAGRAPAQHALSTEIRRKLREGAIAVARRLIARAERDRAVTDVELQMLQAEADLAERRYERAKTRYLAIVTEYAGSPEAELSLFAAAQLSRGKAGVDLLQRYLARYPDGRFAKEAHRLLEALDRPQREKN